MARWEPDARGRLERAAIELFAEQGFAETTVPQIAERAGVTTRTFFRHFADKREVLFGGEDELAKLVAELIADGPRDRSAIDTVEHALKAAAESQFEPRRASMRRWREIVRVEPALQERGLSKQRVLVAAVVQALVDRGIDAQAAELSAGAAFVAFESAAGAWAADSRGARSLAGYFEDAIERMRQAVAGEANDADTER